MADRHSYVTTYCNQAHCRNTGKPIGHGCYILPVKALEAEIEGDFAKAGEILSAWKNRKEHRGLKA